MFKEEHFMWKTFIYLGSFMTLLSYNFLMYLLISKTSYFFHWDLISLGPLKLSISFYVEYKSLIFFFTVFLISISIFYYSLNYMVSDIKFAQFFSLMSIFILSMIILIFSTNFLLLMLGWDGLGITSFLLVIYYNNNNSLNAGFITLFSNRVGDVGLMTCFYYWYNLHSWDINFLSSLNMKMDYLMSLVLLLSAFTKSAQIPFSAWLPAAMAAPTPVSSLVHSSTLVTAGVYLLIRFSPSLNSYEIIFWLSTLTSLSASLAALVEKDMKKIIALSTLSHLGIMMMMISLNLCSLAFTHLIFHAFFKALLFMSVGLMIHLSQNYQDSRKISNLLFLSYMNSSMMIVALISLCGIPYMTGYFSKDFLLEILVFKNFNLVAIVSTYFICALSFGYTVRLISQMILTNTKLNSLSWTDSSSYPYIKSMLILFLASIFLGKNLFFSMLMSTNILFLESSLKLIISIFLIIIFFSFKYLFLRLIFTSNTPLIVTNFFLSILSRNMLIKFGAKYSNLLRITDKTLLVMFSSHLINNYNSLLSLKMLQMNFLQNLKWASMILIISYFMI